MVTTEAALRRKKLLLIGVILVVAVLAGLLIQRVMTMTQNTQIQAEGGATALALSPNTITTRSDEQFSVNVVARPNGDILTLVQLDIRFDPSVMQPDQASPFTPGNALPLVVEGPVVADGSLLVTLSVDGTVLEALRDEETLGTVNFIARADTAGSKISFGPQTLALTAEAERDYTQNVVATTNTTEVAIETEVNEEVAQNTTPSERELISDLNEDGTVSIQDYTILFDCGYGSAERTRRADRQSRFNSRECTSHALRENADLDQNGYIDVVDYNIFIRSLWQR